MKTRLTDTAVRNAKPKPDGKTAKYTDGGGLYLWVSKEAKGWRYDYTRPATGKRNTLVIGTYPEIKLAEARERHREARALLARDVDPSEHRKSVKASQADIEAHSFESIAREWFLRMKPQWSESHTTRTISYLERDVFPFMGSLNINAITPTNIIRVIMRVEERGAGDAARRVKQYIQQVYRYAVTLELAERNPAADIDTSVILKPRSKKHYAAITDPVQVGQLLRDIDGYQGTFVVRCALKLSPLVMLRPGNVRAAEWADIDLDAAVWRIPIAKMKAPTHIKQENRSTHTVPLPRQAVEVFREIQPYSGRFRYVFPSERGASKPLSDNGIRAALRTMGYDNDTMTPHGFRGMASTLLNRMTDPMGKRLWDDDLIEQQLAHTDGTVRGAYNRADSPDAIRQRREMLQAWADYLDGLRNSEINDNK